MSLPTKVLIKESRHFGGGACISPIGTALLTVHNVQLGLRLSPPRCGASQEINRSTECVQYVKLCDKEYVVSSIHGTTDSDRKAIHDGCSYEVTIDVKDGMVFQRHPPIHTLNLIEDYREN